MNGSGDLKKVLLSIKSKVEYLKKQYIPGFNVPTYIIDVDFICKRLEKLPEWKWWRWFPLDGIYYTTTLEGFKKILEWDRTNKHKYYRDRFDCDKYAMYLKSNIAWFFGINAVGVVLDYSSEHAYNIIFTHDKNEPLILEPQTDEVFSIDDRDPRYYALRDYFIIL